MNSHFTRSDSKLPELHTFTAKLWAEQHKKEFILGGLSQEAMLWQWINDLTIYNTDSVLKEAFALQDQYEQFDSLYQQGLRLYPDHLLHLEDQHLSRLVHGISKSRSDINTIVCLVGPAQTRSIPHLLMFDLEKDKKQNSDIYSTILGEDKAEILVDKLTALAALL